MSDDTESRGAVNDPLISPREFCDQAKICPKTLRRIELRGEGPPAVEITPGLRRYRQSAVDAWFAAKTVTGARPAGRTPREATRSRLITNLFDSVGIALRQKRIDCAGALAWLKEEGLLHHLPFGGDQ
jgi:hypothetical protein